MARWNCSTAGLGLTTTAFGRRRGAAVFFRAVVFALVLARRGRTVRRMFAANIAARPGNYKRPTCERPVLLRCPFFEDDEAPTRHHCNPRGPSSQPPRRRL